MRGKKLIIGFLILLITSSVVYIQLLHDVKIRVDNDKTTLYVFEDSRWKIGGREYNKLFDGTRRLYRDVSNVKIYTYINETTNTTTIIRETPYKRGPFIRDTYYFRGDIKDKKLFPVYHKVEVYNASGLFYRYEVRDLVYSGPTYKLNGSTHLRFGRNVDVTLNPGYRWAWVYKSGIVKAQYDVESDYEVFYVRLFDPNSTSTTLYLDGVSADRYYEHGTVAVLKANVTNSTGDLVPDATVCLDIDQVGYGDNYVCDNGTIEYNLTINSVLGEFNDSTTAKNLSYTNAPENQTFYIRLNKYDEVQSAYFDICGYENPLYPKNTKIYVNDTLADFILGYITETEEGTTWTSQFKDGSREGYYILPPNHTKELLLGPTNRVNEGYFKVTGYHTYAANDSLVNGLPQCDDSKPELFEYNSSLYLLVGTGNGIKSYQWNGSEWNENNTFTNGLPSLNNTEVEVFYNNTDLKLILAENNNWYRGYSWNGSAWVEERCTGSIVYGLPEHDCCFDGTTAECASQEMDRLDKIISYDAHHGGWGGPCETVVALRNLAQVAYDRGDYYTAYYRCKEANGKQEECMAGRNIQRPIVSVYKIDSDLKMFIGYKTKNYFSSYEFNSNVWIYNSSLKTGIETKYYSSPEVYYKKGTRFLCLGGLDSLNTYNWNGSNWINNNISKYIQYSQDKPVISVFNESEVIIGSESGYYKGYNIENLYNPQIYQEDILIWNWSGYLYHSNNTQIINFSIGNLNNYLDGGDSDPDIIFVSENKGILKYYDLYLNYNYSYNSTRNLTTAIQNYLDAQPSSGYYNIPIKISSETNSTIQVDNINITYYGSDNITVTAHFDGDANYNASNDTHIVKVVYSRYNTSIPVNYGYLEFIPNTPTDKNVSCYGQLETKPAINISWLNYDQPANLSMKINETHPCINITVSTTYNKSAGYVLNTSYIQLDSNKNLTDNTYLYLWADYACNYTDPYWRWWLPEFLLKAVCTNCVKGD